MKVLFTTPMLEYPPKSGPHLRIDNSIKALSRVADLHILSRVPKFLMGGDDAVAFYKRHAKHFGFTPSVNKLSSLKWVRRAQKVIRTLTADDAEYLIQYAQTHNIDVIWFGYGNLSYSVIKKAYQKSSTLKYICDTDSVWSRFIARELPFVEADTQKQQILKAVKEKEIEEKNWVKWCNITTAVSDVDAEFYKDISPSADKIKLFPNVIDMNFYKEATNPPIDFKQPAVILSGSFGKDSSPMNRAASWVISEIWPKVIQKIPLAHLYIVGNYSDISFSHLKEKSITVAGRVPSILPYLQHAQCAITPLQFESGTRFKILEAAACQTPMVSTTLGAEGLDVQHEEHLLIADTAEDFARGIVSLISNKELSEKLALNSYEYVRQNFDLPVLENYAKTILEEVRFA